MDVRGWQGGKGVLKRLVRYAGGLKGYERAEESDRRRL